MAWAPGLAIVLLVLANLLNNRWAARAYVVTCVATTAVLLALLPLAGLGWADAGLARADLVEGARWGLACAGIVAAGYLIGALLPRTRVWFVDRRAERAGPRDLWYQMGVRIPFGTVLLEEVAFRGVLYGLAAAAYGPAWAVLLSSVLFGLWHVLPSRGAVRDNRGAGQAFGARPALVVPAAVVASALAGLVLLELRRRTGSLVPALSVHWATNALGYLTAYLVTKRSTSSATS